MPRKSSSARSVIIAAVNHDGRMLPATRPTNARSHAILLGARGRGNETKLQLHIKLMHFLWFC